MSEGNELRFLETLEAVIDDRLEQAPDSSYTAKLAARGRATIAQKVGEEGVELALAAVSEDDGRVTAEAADLMYHVVVLLRVRGLRLADVVAELESRHRDAGGRAVT